MREPPAEGYNVVHLPGESDARYALEQGANRFLSGYGKEAASASA
jgi:hypothetical protein